MTPPPDDKDMPKKLDLPQSLQSLTQMREELGAYLATLEHNTDTVTQWLKDNRKDIIVALHQLVRAVTLAKSDAAAVKALEALNPEVATFVLGLEDFNALAETHLGGKSRFAQKIATIQAGIPAGILQPLPEVAVPQDDTILQRPRMESLLDAKTTTDAPKGGILSGWFKSAEQREAEKAAEDIEAMLGHWRKLHRDLVGLQSDRHYYVDAFMDWVGENLAPSDPDQDFARLMEKYQHPAYVVERAQADYAAAVGIKADSLRNDARAYSRLAGFIDRQDIQGFIAELPRLFPTRPSPQTIELREMLLKDFGAVSFAELGLRAVRDRGDQFEVFRHAITLEEGIKLAGAANRTETMRQILAEAVHKDDPINPAILALAMKSLAQDAEGAMVLARRTEALKAVYTRFKGDDSALKGALDGLMRGLRAQDPAVAAMVVDFAAARDKASAADMARILDAVAEKKCGRMFSALWLLTQEAPLLASMMPALDAAGAQDVAGLLFKGFAANVMDELRATSASAQGGARAFDAFAAIIEDYALKDSANFGAQNIGKLAALCGLDVEEPRLREKLVKKDGWLAQAARLQGGADAHVLAALLTTAPAAVQKTALLDEAARNNGGDAQVTARLEACADNLTGGALRLNRNRILSNPAEISSIWHKDNPASVYYTHSGVSQTVAEGLHPRHAEDMMAVLAKRHDFMGEQQGLFHPALIDSFEFEGGNAVMSWHRQEASLNIGPAAQSTLRQREDFIHETSADMKKLRSFNKSAVMLLMPYGDENWLMVDRYGRTTMLDRLTVEEGAPLVKVGEAYINPANAALLSIDAKDNALSFRLETAAFNDLLKAMKGHELLDANLQDDFFFQLRGTAEDIAGAQKAAKALKGMVGGNAQIDGLYFNMPVLGYLMPVNERGICGLSCSKQGMPANPGMISADAELIDDITLALRKAKDSVIEIGGCFVSTDSIYNIYYQRKDATLFILTENDGLSLACEEKEAAALLKKLAAVEGFKAIRFADPYHREEPSDLLRLSRASMVYFNEDDQASYAVIGNRQIPLGLTRIELDFLVNEIDIASRKERAAQNPLPPELAQLQKSLMTMVIFEREPGEIKAQGLALGDLGADHLWKVAITEKPAADGAPAAPKAQDAKKTPPKKAKGFGFF